MSKSETLPRWAWLWAPVLALAFQIVLEFTLPLNVRAGLVTENGPHETLQFIVMAAAFCAALAALRRVNWRTQKWLGLWLVLAAGCCFYVAGEEISWGQHLLHWATPEFWAHLNDQNETNLHNTSSWLDQKPRLLLQIGIVAGGLVLPFLRRFKSSLLPQKFAVIYPPDILSVTALCALFINLIDRMKTFPVFERASEIEELYMFYFILLYLLVLRCRVMQNQG